MFKNYESGAYGYIGFAKALEVSCNTFFYRVGYDFWQRFGSDVDDVNARDPLVEEAQTFGFGDETGIDLPGEASGRIADRKWKRAYWKQMKDYYCGIAGKPQDGETSDFVYTFAGEFCVEGFAYRAGDAVNFAIGQGDTIVTPLQLTRAYAAIANGGTLWEPRIAKAIVSPDGTVLKKFQPEKGGDVHVPDSVIGYIDTALKGVALRGTMNWRLLEFPLDQVQIRAKTGSAEVYGKQSTSWVASYTDDYVGGDDGQPGRHRLRHVGSGHPQDLRGALRHQGHGRRPRACRDPRRRRPGRRCRRSPRDGAILPPRPRSAK